MRFTAHSRQGSRLLLMRYWVYYGSPLQPQLAVCATQLRAHSILHGAGSFSLCILSASQVVQARTRLRRLPPYCVPISSALTRCWTLPGMSPLRGTQVRPPARKPRRSSIL